MPSIGGEPFTDVLAERDVGRAVDRDAVVVVEHGQLAETKMTGKRSGFGGDPFHHVPIGGDHPRAVIHDVVAWLVEASREMLLCHRHPDGVPDALAERPSGRVDTRREVGLRVPRRKAPPLPKITDVIERERVAG